MALTDKLTAIAEGFRSSRGITRKLSFEEMAMLASVPIQSGGGDAGSPRVVENVVDVAATVQIFMPSGIEYYYNHEQLPEIPADVVEEYPYLLIMRGSSIMRLVASTEKAYYHTAEDGSKRITVNSSGRVYRADVNTEAGGWVSVGFSAGTWFGVNGSATYTAWWSNYDIPNGSADSGEIYFPASVPQEEQPADVTHYYYNGVRLPAIPADVLASYPYVLMLPNKIVYAFSVVPYWYPTSQYPTCIKADGAGVRYKYVEDADAWEFHESLASIYQIVSNGVTWANYDIPNGSATATDIYLYGTLAVPDPA